MPENIHNHREEDPKDGIGEQLQKIADEIEDKEVHEKEGIKKIIELPIGPALKSEVLRVYLEEQPGSEFSAKLDEKDLEKFTDLEKIGLKVFTDSSSKETRVCISKDQEIIDELKNLSPSVESNHKRYGEIMGYPLTAIEAFLDKEKRLSNEEQDKILEGMPHFLRFSFSKNNWKEELSVIKRWHKILLEKAPELFDDLYPPEEAKKFRENIEKM